MQGENVNTYINLNGFTVGQINIMSILGFNNYIFRDTFISLTLFITLIYKKIKISDPGKRKNIPLKKMARM